MGDSAVSPKKVHLHLSGYVLMKWTLQTHTRCVTSQTPQLWLLCRLIGPANGIVSFFSHTQEKGVQLNSIGAYSNAGTWAPGGPSSPDI